MDPLGSKVDRLTQSVESLKASKRAAILAGVDGTAYEDADTGPHFLKSLADWRQDPEANAYIKAVLGTSAATGQAIVPNNFVAQIAHIGRPGSASSDPGRSSSGRTRVRR